MLQARQDINGIYGYEQPELAREYGLGVLMYMIESNQWLSNIYRRRNIAKEMVTIGKR